jgi:hypothetical protein
VKPQPPIGAYGRAARLGRVEVRGASMVGPPGHVLRTRPWDRAMWTCRIGWSRGLDGSAARRTPLINNPDPAGALSLGLIEPGITPYLARCCVAQPIPLGLLGQQLAGVGRAHPAKLAPDLFVESAQPLPPPGQRPPGPPAPSNSQPISTKAASRALVTSQGRTGASQGRVRPRSPHMSWGPASPTASGRRSQRPTCKRGTSIRRYP